MILSDIIKNEIEALLEHRPNKEELKSACDYIYENISDKDMLVDISLTLHDWRGDCCKQCEVCGGYFLTDQIEERWAGMGFHNVCSVECYQFLKDDYE